MARPRAAHQQALGLALSVCVAFLRSDCEAQTPAPSVMVSFGVDTAAADVGDIVRLVRAYLAQPDTSALTRGLWSTADALDRRVGDLHRSFAYQGFPATVVGVMSAGPGDSVYIVKVLHATADSTGRQVMPLALQRLYTVRAPDAEYGWQLYNALPRLTRGWPSQTPLTRTQPTAYSPRIRLPLWTTEKHFLRKLSVKKRPQRATILIPFFRNPKKHQNRRNPNRIR